MKNADSNPALLSPKTLVPVFWGVSLIWSISWFEPHALLRLASVGFCFLAAILSFGQGIKEGFYRPHGAVVITLLLFWMLAAASIFWSAIPFVSFIAFCTYSMLPLTFFALVTNRDAGDLLKACTLGALVFCAILALYVVIQYFFMPDMLVSGTVRYPFANPNSFAAMLSLALFGGIALMVTAEDRKYSNMALLFSVLYVAAIVILAGRGAFLALLIGLFVFMLGAGKEVLTKHKRCIGGLFAGSVIVLAVTALMGASRNTIWERLGQIGEKGEQIVAGRSDIWQATWTMIEQHMFAGTGIGTFFLYYPEHRLPSDWYSGGYMAHNDPLQFWMEMGVLAPLLFYAALVFVLIRSFFALRAMTESTDKRRLHLLAVTCGMGAFVLHTHISFHFYVGPLLLIFGLALAWWYVLTADILKETASLARWPVRWPVVAGWVAALLPFLVLYFVLQGFLFSEYYIDRSQARMIKGDTGGFAEDINHADRVGFGMNARAYIKAAAIPLGILDAASAAMTDGERKSLEKQINTLLDKAEQHNPRLVGIPYYRAMLAGYMQHPDSEIEGYLQQAVTLSPQHLPSRMMLIQYYQDHGEVEKASSVARAGLPWRYGIHDPAPYYMKAIEVFVAVGDQTALETAQKKLNTVSARNARWKRERERVTPQQEYGPDGSVFVP